MRQGLPGEVVSLIRSNDIVGKNRQAFRHKKMSDRFFPAI